MLIVRKEAEEDIRSAYEWYEKQLPNLGRAFLVELEKKLKDIEEHPELYSIATGDARRAFCRKFPYSIYFLRCNINVIVIGVLHQRRNPSVWKERKDAGEMTDGDNTFGRG